VVARLTQPGGGDGAFDSLRVFRLTAAPQVLETFPVKDATQVDPGVVILVLFSAPMSEHGFTLETSNGTPVNGITRLDKDVLTFAPSSPLTTGERYTIRVSSAKDLAGQSIASPVTSSFVVTATAPATAPVLTTPSGSFCGTAVEVNGTATPSARVRIEYGTVAVTTTASASGAFSHTMPLSGRAGFHVIRVRTLGSDGSLSPFAELKLNVDCARLRILGATYDRVANLITITYSEDVGTPSATNFTPAGTITVNGAVVILTPNDDLRSQTFTLTSIDPPFSQLFEYADAPPQSGEGRGIISGEVYDEATGRPLAGATITIGSLTVTTDPRGRYLAAVDEGAHTVVVNMPGYVTAYREVTIAAGAAQTPIDFRLERK
jgi:hypothetical protein